MRRQADTKSFERARRMLEIESEWGRVAVDDVLVEDADGGWRVSAQPHAGAAVVTARLIDDTGFQVGFVELDPAPSGGWRCFVPRPAWWNESCAIEVAAFRPRAARSVVPRPTSSGGKVLGVVAALTIAAGLLWKVTTDGDKIRPETPPGRPYPPADANIIGRSGGSCTAIAVDGELLYVSVKDVASGGSLIRRLGRDGGATTLLRVPGAVQKLAVRGAAVYTGEPSGVYYQSLDAVESSRRLVEPSIAGEPCGVEALLLVGNHVRWAAESAQQTPPACGRRAEVHVTSVSSVPVELPTRTPGDLFVYAEYYDRDRGASNPWQDLRILPRAAFGVPAGASVGTLAAWVSLMVVPHGKDVDVLAKRGTHDPKGNADTYRQGWGCRDCRIQDMVVANGYGAWSYRGSGGSGLARARAPYAAERAEGWVFEALATNTPVAGLVAANDALYWCEENGVVSKHVWAEPFAAQENGPSR